jgi:heme exporter protein C
MHTPSGRLPAGWQDIGRAALVAMVLAALAAAFLAVPTERTMGDAQRIVYLHVSVAWVGLAGALLMAVAGALYLLRRDLRWDHWAHAAAELGWLGATLTLVTGSLWARAAWNVWWTWDPRLTTALVLWALYSGCLLLRGGVDDPHRRARLAAVLAIATAADLPLVLMATRWFRGIHPASPTMEPSMRAVLLANVLAFTALFALLLTMRRNQLELERLVEELTEKDEG